MAHPSGFRRRLAAVAIATLAVLAAAAPVAADRMRALERRVSGRSTRAASVLPAAAGSLQRHAASPNARADLSFSADGAAADQALATHLFGWDEDTAPALRATGSALLELSLDKRGAIRAQRQRQQQRHRHGHASAPHHRFQTTAPAKHRPVGAAITRQVFDSTVPPPQPEFVFPKVGELSGKPFKWFDEAKKAVEVAKANVRAEPWDPDGVRPPGLPFSAQVAKAADWEAQKKRLDIVTAISKVKYDALKALKDLRSLQDRMQNGTATPEQSAQMANDIIQVKLRFKQAVQAQEECESDVAACLKLYPPTTVNLADDDLAEQAQAYANKVAPAVQLLRDPEVPPVPKTPPITPDEANETADSTFDTLPGTTAA